VNFHPRYGFIFPQSVSGTFICRSEDIEHQETLTVKTIRSPKTSNSRSTEFVSSIVSVECESKGSVQIPQNVHWLREHTHLTFNGTTITKKETALDGRGKWISSYELVAKSPTYINLTCVDDNLKPTWTKQLHFVRK
jgi:hypothetical protein